jgi:hypothetical protein
MYTHTHTHNGILLSHKENEIMLLVGRWMELETIMLSESIACSHSFVETALKMII